MKSNRRTKKTRKKAQGELAALTAAGLRISADGCLWDAKDWLRTRKKAEWRKGDTV